MLSSSGLTTRKSWWLTITERVSAVSTLVLAAGTHRITRLQTHIRPIFRAPSFLAKTITTRASWTSRRLATTLARLFRCWRARVCHGTTYVSRSPSFFGSDRPRFQTHMTIEGPVVLDIVQHFVERWDLVKLQKVYSHRLLITTRTKLAHSCS